MIQSYILHTSEVDIAEDAVREVQTQLAAISLKTHSIGILTCHFEYIHTGVMAALTESLPFDTVGVTTFSQMNGTESGMFELSVLVLTSDTVCFEPLLTPPIAEENAAESIADAYTGALGQSGLDPSLIFAFLPFDLVISGDAFLRHLDAASGGVPCFGGYSVDNNQSLLGKTTSYALCNGQAVQNQCVLLLLRGEVQSRFYVANYLRERLLDQSLTVTHAKGRLVHEVNGIPFTRYLARYGIDSVEAGALSTIPVLCRMNEGDEFVSRAMIAAEGESIRFISEVPEGATLLIGVWTVEDVTGTSCAAAARAVRENPDAAAMLIFSCLGRYAALGLDIDAEIRCVFDTIGRENPALMAYSGGELAPSMKNGQSVNTAHNTSLVICALQ